MYKYTIAVLFLIFGLTSYTTQAQECGTTQHMEMLMQAHPEIKQNRQNIEAYTQQLKNNTFKTNASNVIVIPVVVHVLYYYNFQNISEAQIQSQIDVLNEDFRRLNSDTNNRWSQADDAQIMFCLAKIDPNGDSTNGITRTNTPVQVFGGDDNSIKFNAQGGKDAWPYQKYLNIWVGNIGTRILGYAQFPGGPANTDGVVIHYKYFGNIGTATSPYNLGRTATHEIGHWLNLYHIWGDGGCMATDYVDDTPNASAASYGCQVGKATCGTSDMVENYMDYSEDACMNLFTADQKSRMHALFEPGGFRFSLTQSTVCNITSCFDGQKNGQETGIDCGGPDCKPCAQNGPCKPLQNLQSTPLNNGTSAQLLWKKDPEANTYTVSYKEQMQAVFTDTVTADTFFVMNQLTPGLHYSWTVKANCNNAVSENTTQNFIAGTSVIQGISDFILYPNPVLTEIKLGFNTTQSAVKINVFNAAGQLVYSKENNFALGDAVWQINVENLSAGVYLIRLSYGNTVKFKRFIKL